MSGLRPNDSLKPTPTRRSLNRLDLARWLVSHENPLTPRVTVNHIWARLFGEGLVRTVADFGVRGERAVASRTARLARRHLHGERLEPEETHHADHAQRHLPAGAARHGPELADIDPQNKLLHRQNRFRVEGEIVRDLHLAASGLLSAKIGGPERLSADAGGHRRA